MAITEETARSPFAGATDCSTEPNAPHPPHLPNHFAVRKPHSRQTCCIAALEEPMGAPCQGGLTWSQNETPETCQCNRRARLENMRAAVIGGGSWGTELASGLGGNGHDTIVWAHDAESARALNEHHENTKYLPGLKLPDKVKGTHDLTVALAGAEIVVAVNPSHVTREVMREAVPLLPRATPIVCATKG